MRTPKSRLRAARASAVPADTDQAMSKLYAHNYRPLVRLAALLVGDPAAAEKVVQDAFVDLHCALIDLQCAGPRRSGPDVALAQLRRAVIERSRSAPPVSATAGSAAASTALVAAGGAAAPAALVAALRRLPARQREVLVLHYFADLTEAQIAAATGIGPDAVRSHIAVAFSLLRAELPAVA